MDDVHSFVDAVEAFWGHLAAVGWGALLLGCLMHVFRLTARVRAWQNIIRPPIPRPVSAFRDVFCAYWAGVGVNAITPARGGDVVKLYIAKHRVNGTTYPTLASSLLVETLFDLFVGVCHAPHRRPARAASGDPGPAEAPGLRLVVRRRAPEDRGIFGFGLLIVVAVHRLGDQHVVAFKERVKLGFAILGTSTTT